MRHGVKRQATVVAARDGSYHTDRTNTHVRTVRTYMENKATQENSVEAQEHAKDCRLSSVTVYPFSSRDSLKPLAGAICARMLFGLTDLLHVSVLFFNTEHGIEKKNVGFQDGSGMELFFRLVCEGKTR